MSRATLERDACLDGSLLPGSSVTANWNAGLTTALHHRGRALQEKQLL